MHESSKVDQGVNTSYEGFNVARKNFKAGNFKRNMNILEELKKSLKIIEPEEDDEFKRKLQSKFKLN